MGRKKTLCRFFFSSFVRLFLLGVFVINIAAENFSVISFSSLSLSFLPLVGQCFFKGVHVKVYVKAYKQIVKS